ncbi:MAG: hypothetical protein Ct9H300mP19_14850 [Dehalococcoidia bacterium]|nr:MAG: hypothetical protein Ct9H300mP19_14850 [Dehalococcoidia bacterium]
MMLRIQLFPFKDRVVSVAATKAVEFDFDTIACASTGNLAGATAAQVRKLNEYYGVIP